MDIQSQKGQTVYKTQGDANNVADQSLVEPSKIVGMYIYRIPYGGLVLSKLKGPIGLGIVWALFMYVIISEFFFRKKDKNVIVDVEKSGNENI